MQFIPYLNFDGDCAEAFAFYARLFNGTITYQGIFGEVPAEAGMPPLSDAARDRVMHVHLRIGEQSLMGSDTLPTAPGEDPATCGGYQEPQGPWVSIQVADEAEGRRVFDGLAAGGKVAKPFAGTFFSSGFGMVTDRYGTPWMVNVTQAA